MKEIEANRRAWTLPAQDHHGFFTDAPGINRSPVGETITRELGDVTGNSIIHVGCDTGAGTMSLARSMLLPL